MDGGFNKTKKGVAYTVDEYGNVVAARDETVPDIQGNPYAPVSKKWRKAKGSTPRRTAKPQPKAAKKAVKPQPLPQGADPARMEICQECGAQVRRDRMARHLLKVHPRSKAATLAKKGVTVYKAAPTAKATPPASTSTPVTPSSAAISTSVPKPTAPVKAAPPAVPAKADRYRRENVQSLSKQDKVGAPKTTSGKSKQDRSPSVTSKPPKTVQVQWAPDGNYQCPFCVHSISVQALVTAHIKDKHKNQSVTLVFPDPKTRKRRPVARNSTGDGSPQFTSLSSHDSQDGGKYLGHMRREQGKFGSLPLYDDYDE